MRHLLLIVLLISACTPPTDPQDAEVGDVEVVIDGSSGTEDGVATEDTPVVLPEVQIEVRPEVTIINGVCSSECREDDDCGEGFLCRQFGGTVFGCVDPANPQVPVTYAEASSILGVCQADVQCGRGEGCTYNRERRRCFARCMYHEDCPGRWCVQGACAQCDPTTGSGCGGGLVCDLVPSADIGTCLPLCGDEEDCAAAGRVCIGR